mmetsp:Transcript_14230/g.2319  ORF Transcript_14230/g.2319 Transcript_14230/m.2319 type:complete len:157 (+) Transcript_14230:1098-1568(+)
MDADESKSNEILESQMWSYSRFERYLIESGMVNETWMDDVFRPYMKRSMLHLSRMAYSKLLNHPRVYALYGVDFMLDDKMNLWFLEMTSSPAMQATTKEKGNIQGKMQQDIFDIQYALLYEADLDEVVSKTGFEWVIDGRKAGEERYCGLISLNCF